MDLEDIAEKEELVLFDTSINNLDYFLWDLFPTKTYAEMNFGSITKVQNDLSTLYNFVDFKNTFTIEEVLKELYSLQKKLNVKAIEFNKKEKRFKQIYKKKRIKLSNTNRKEYDKLLKIMQDLIQKIKKNIIYKSKDPIYKVIYNSILNINERLNLTANLILHKRDFKQPKLFLKEYIDLKTDEKLVARLFYSSMVKNKSCTLITKDDGLRRLAIKFHKFIYINNTSSCESLKKDLKKIPIRIYIPYPLNQPKSTDYKLGFTSKDDYAKCELIKEIKELKELKKDGYQVIDFKLSQTSS